MKLFVVEGICKMMISYSREDGTGRRDISDYLNNGIPRLSTVWEHSLTNSLEHDHTTEPRMALRH